MQVDNGGKTFELDVLRFYEDVLIASRAVMEPRCYRLRLLMVVM